MIGAHLMGAYRSVMFAGLVLLACGATTLAGEYKDPSGFSFTYPDGWVLLTPDKIKGSKAGLSEEIKSWIDEHEEGLTSMAAILVRDSKDEYLESLGVLVNPVQVPANPETVKAFSTVLKTQYKTMGLELNNFNCSVQDIANRKSVVAEYDIHLDGEEDDHEKRLVIPGGGKSYIFVCTGSDKSYKKYEPVFGQVLASLKVPDPVAEKTSTRTRIPFKLIGLAIGAVIVAGGWFFKKFMGDDQPARRSAPSTQIGPPPGSE